LTRFEGRLRSLDDARAAPGEHCLPSRRFQARWNKGSIVTPLSLLSNPASYAGAVQEFELRFRPLLSGARGYAFPCDAAGHVALDDIAERTRNDYFFARALVGRGLSRPVVQPAAMNDYWRRA